jgi:hypothetical protein
MVEQKESEKERCVAKEFALMKIPYCDLFHEASSCPALCPTSPSRSLSSPFWRGCLKKKWVISWLIAQPAYLVMETSREEITYLVHA